MSDAPRESELRTYKVDRNLVSCKEMDERITAEWKEFNANEKRFGVNGNLIPKDDMIRKSRVIRDNYFAGNDILEYLQSRITTAMALDEDRTEYTLGDEVGEAWVAKAPRITDTTAYGIETETVVTPVLSYGVAFTMSWQERSLDARKNSGQKRARGLSSASRKVGEKHELALLDGNTTVKVGGQTSQGIRNFALKQNIAKGSLGTLAGGDTASWLNHVRAIRKAYIDRDLPFESVGITLFVNSGDWNAAVTQDRSSSLLQTTADRVRALPGVRDVVPSARIATETIVACLVSPEFMSMNTAMQPRAVERNRESQFAPYTTDVLAMSGLEIYRDTNNKNGIVTVNIA